MRFSLAFKKNFLCINAFEQLLVHLSSQNGICSVLTIFKTHFSWCEIMHHEHISLERLHICPFPSIVSSGSRGWAEAGGVRGEACRPPCRRAPDLLTTVVGGPSAPRTAASWPAAAGAWPPSQWLMAKGCPHARLWPCVLTSPDLVLISFCVHRKPWWMSLWKTATLRTGWGTCGGAMRRPWASCARGRGSWRL